MRCRILVLALPVLLVACSSVDPQGTIGQLRNMQIEIKEEHLDGGLEKAMESYQRFLHDTPDSPLAPEAIRRLADLKVEREYGLLTGSDRPPAAAPAAAMSAPERAVPGDWVQNRQAAAPSDPEPAPATVPGESDPDFESRATGSTPVADLAAAGDGLFTGGDDLERAGPLEAIELYRKLLREYPHYQRNDQVLYQMSRAFEELGRTGEAMEVMDQLVRDFPRSRYFDEVQFRRAEYFFVHRRFLDAEDAYTSIVDFGVGSSFFQLALYKLGWTFYKQELYEAGLDRFIALLDHQVSVGYDFAQTEDEPERKRMEDTFRVISLSFSYLGGAEVVVDYFSSHGQRGYEDEIYRNLAEYYFDKRRYSDAIATYQAFVSRNPFHRMSPHFDMRVIEINMAGGFPSLVIDAKKSFATKYGLQAEYWQHFEPGDHPDVLGYLKTNLTDLANHYHALYQDPLQAEGKAENFGESLHWYREFLVSFPTDPDSPAINYLLADLLLENRSFEAAAVEYEKTSYGYPVHEKSATAGYAAVYAYRQQLAAVSAEAGGQIKREVVRSSLRFADSYPEHEKAALVLGAAADDLYALQDFEPAATAARKLIATFPGADPDIMRSAWIVVGHSTYELQLFAEAGAAYVMVLALLPEGDKTREALVDNLAASIYRQGEEANAREDRRAAADHFLRVGRMAPTSKIRPSAEFDAAAALILLQDWKTAATVLSGFRETFPGHELQTEVTKKMAYVYREDGQLGLAADEYERIERESRDDEVRREALLIAAQLHEQAGNRARTLAVYRRYVDFFPAPVEVNLETRSKIAEILKKQDDRQGYLAELRDIVAIEAGAGSGRSARTRYLAAVSALVLAEEKYDQFVAVRLEKPLEENLAKKRKLMKTATQDFSLLLDYEVGEVSAAGMFYLGEIYAHFSRALTESERPEGLSALELEQYELAIEEQAYPFEEKAIDIHEKNLKLIAQGVYNSWIDKSLQKLAQFVPARYARPEAISGVVVSPESFMFAINRPGPAGPPAAQAQAVAEALPGAEPLPAEGPVPTAGEAQGAEPAAVEEPPEARGVPLAKVAEPAIQSTGGTSSGVQ